MTEERENLSPLAAHVRWKNGAYRCSFCAWTRDNSPGWSREPFQHILEAHPEWTTPEAVAKMDAARAAAVRRREEKRAKVGRNP